MVNIEDHPEVVKAVNAILNNKGAAEIKLERNGKEIVVVEPTRTVKFREATEK